MVTGDRHQAVNRRMTTHGTPPTDARVEGRGNSRDCTPRESSGLRFTQQQGI